MSSNLTPEVPLSTPAPLLVECMGGGPWDGLRVGIPLYGGTISTRFLFEGLQRNNQRTPQSNGFDYELTYHPDANTLSWRWRQL